jgi:hypothetical protein
MSRMKMMNRSYGGGDESMVDMLRKTSGEDAKLRMMLGMDAKEDHPTPPNDYFSYGTLKHERQMAPVPDYSRQKRATGGSTYDRHYYDIGGSVGQTPDTYPNQQQQMPQQQPQPAQAGMGAGGSGYGSGYGVQQNPGQQQNAQRPLYADGGSTGYGTDRGNNDGNTAQRRDLYNHGGGIEIEIKRVGRRNMTDDDMDHMGEVDRMEQRHGKPRSRQPDADIDEGFMEVLGRHGIPLHALSERDMAVLGRSRQGRATGGSMDMGRLKEKTRRFEDHEPRALRRGGRSCHAAGAVAKVRKGQY